MPSGSCLCGQTTMSLSGEPEMKALCHCTDCQKITGSTYSTNLIVNENDFKFTGTTPKQYAKKSDANRNIVSHFCGNCGSTLARTGDAFPGKVIIKAGTLDGGLAMAEPGAELFTSARPKWVAETPGAHQLEGMPS